MIMTNATVPEHAPDPIEAALAEAATRADRARRERQAADAAAILSALKGEAPAEVAEVAEFKTRPTQVAGYHDETVEITRVRVTVTRYASDDPDDDGTGYVRVEGYGRPLTRNGTPDQRHEAWWYSLPDELAAPLLLQAHTHAR